jgi:hypothetical protein
MLATGGRPGGQHLVRLLIIFYPRIMTETPFRDTAHKIARSMDFMTMSFNSGRARSHGWWRNLVEHGPWRGPGATRVGPPDPEALPGIARLFGTSEDQVRIMVAADWYGVHPNQDVSALARRLSPALDRLSEEDVELVQALLRRLDEGTSDASEARSEAS